MIETFEEELQMADFEEQIILKRQKRIQGFLEKVKIQMLKRSISLVFKLKFTEKKNIPLMNFFLII